MIAAPSECDRPDWQASIFGDPGKLSGRRYMHSINRLLVILILLFPTTCPAISDEHNSTIPLSLNEGEYGGGRIYAPVRFGNVLGMMRLDTGATSSRITFALWNKDFPVVGQTESIGSSGKSTHCDDVEAKNVLLKAVQGPSIGRAKYTLTRCASSDGDDLLGVDFFKGTRFQLDLARREIVFPDPKASPSQQFQTFVMLGGDRRLVGLKAQIGDAPVIGLFDSGAELSAVDLTFVKSHTEHFTPVKHRLKVSEAGGAKWAPKLYRLKEIDIGEGRILKGLYILAYDFGVLREALGARTPIIFGYNFLSQFQWELDFTPADAPRWRAKLYDHRP